MDFKYDKDNKVYWTSYNMESKSCVIAFMEEKRQKDINKIYSVAFGIGNNRKQVLNWMFEGKNFLDNKVTGTGSVKYLIWAKNMIIEFENFIKNKKSSEKIMIGIRGADKRRYRVYAKVLTKYGYESCCENLTKILN